MTAVMVGFAVAVLIVYTASQYRLEHERLRALVASPVVPKSGGPIVFVARLLRGAPLVGRFAQQERYERSVRLAMLLCLPLLIVAPKAAVVLGVILLSRPFLVERRSRKERERSILRELPVVAEMLRLSVASGLNVSVSVERVVCYSSGPIADELSRALSDVRQGRRLADAIELAGQRLGDEVYPLINAIVSSERYGSPLGDSMERLALETRRSQERRAVQVGQKLAVQLLFPIAVTTLPAFVALTVPPLIAGSIGSLALHHS